MTAEERSSRWIAELDEVETMSEAELLDECRRIEGSGGFAGCVASASIRVWEAARAQAAAERRPCRKCWMDNPHAQQNPDRHISLAVPLLEGRTPLAGER